MKKTYIILGILVVGILIGTIVVMYEWNRKPRQVSETAAAFKVSANDLMGAFKKDSAAARLKYDNNVIEVTGTINQIDLSDSGRRINATFNGDGMDLIATFAKSENKNFALIKPGSQVSFKGEYIGLEVDELMPDFPPTLRMDKCILVK
jgi:hypothetical protein